MAATPPPNISIDVVTRPRTQIQYKQGGTLSLKVFVDGVFQVPSAATITVLRYGGAPCATPVTNAPVTNIAGATGLITYSLTAGNADILPGFGDAYAPWTANWTVTLASGPAAGVYRFVTVFDVVLWPIYNVVTQDDLLAHHPDLTDTLFAGESGAQVYINQAQEDVYRRIEMAGNRAWLYIDGEQLRRPTEHRALELYFATRWKDKNDRWYGLMQQHGREFTDWFGSTKFIYDVAQTGTVTPDEVNRPNNQPYWRF